MTTVRCTIEMDLVEGRDFKMRGRKKKEFILEKAAEEFSKIVGSNGGLDIWDYIQTKIVEVA